MKTVVFLILFVTGCSHFSQTYSRSKVYIKKEWVKSTLQTHDITYRKTHSMAPLLINQTLVAANAVDGVTAYRAHDGQRLWSFFVRGGVEAGMAWINDRLFFGGNDGEFYSVSLSDGKPHWSFSTKSENLGAPVIHDGIVYVQTGASVVYALDASNGHQVWIYSRIEGSGLSVRGAAKPVLIKDTLYVGFADGFLVALNAKTGTLKWETALNKNRKYKDIDAFVVQDGDLLYVTGYDSGLYCLKQETGNLVWKMEPGGHSAVTIANQHLLYSSSQGEVLSVDKASGQVQWKHRGFVGIGTQPVVVDGLVYVNDTEGPLRVFDLESGKMVYHLDFGRGSSAPVSADVNSKRLYILSREANLYALSIKMINEKEGISWLNNW